MRFSRCLRGWGARAIAIALLSFSASSAHAVHSTAEITAESRKLAAKNFADGEQAFKAGDYTLAAQLFESAYELAPHEDALWNAARARHRMGELAAAANLYASYLRDAPAGARDRGNATALLGQLSPKLGRIEVHGTGLSSFRVDDRVRTFDLIYVNPGAHTVSASIGERQLSETVSVAAGSIVSITLGDREQPSAIQTRKATDDVEAPPRESTLPDRSSAAPSVLVAVSGGLTIIVGGLTIASGVDTLNAKSTFDSAHTSANLDAGRSKQTRTNVGIGATVGLAALTTAATIWFLSTRSSSGKELRAGVSPASLSLSGTF